MQASCTSKPTYIFRLQFDRGPFRRHRHHRSGDGRRHQAGDPVPESGIYEAVHANAHRAPHEVVMLAGDLFPLCDTCEQNVRFRLVRGAPYIFDDEDFEPEG